MEALELINKWDVVNNRWRDDLLSDPQDNVGWHASLAEFKRNTEEFRMATQDILNARQKTHGNFHINATFSRGLKSVMRDAPNWPSLSPVQKEALDVIQAKIARILSGNPNELDHWQDIAGYAELARQDIGGISEEFCVSTTEELHKLSVGQKIDMGPAPKLFDFRVPKPVSPFCECEHCEALRTKEAKNARKED